MASAPLFGNPAISELLTRGFASQPHDWFAVIGEGSKSNLLQSGDSKVSARALDRVQDDCLSVLVNDLSFITKLFVVSFLSAGG